jgi:hypothetical protein
MEMDS